MSEITVISLTCATI